MKHHFKDKSLRYSGYDYASEGAYFITLNIKNRHQLFGKVVDEKMVLSEIGKVVKKEWERTAQIRKEIVLGEFVVMPDHFHAVIFNVGSNCIVGSNCNSIVRNSIVPNSSSSLILGEISKFRSPKGNTLGSIIRGFKNACTKIIRKELGHPEFQWQANYYDRIIRNQRQLINIENYIRANPEKWSSYK